MATISVGNIKFNWKGPWSNSTTYAVDDVVSHSGSSYISIQAGSNQNPASASAYWQQMSSAGTNGTDVGATLANKEIAFKTNAGAVDGIPIGNAGEFLKVNSGATGYEYGAVSSDFVRLLTSDYSTAVSQIDLDNIFSSTYRGYKILIEDARASGNNNGEVQIRFLDTSGAEISGSYYQMNAGGQYHSAGSSAGSNNGYDNNRSSARLGNWNTANAGEPRPNLFELTFGEMHLNKEHSFLYTAKHFDPSGNYDATVIGGVRYAQATATRGIRVMVNGGHNFSAYKITVWGLK